MALTFAFERFCSLMNLLSGACAETVYSYIALNYEKKTHFSTSTEPAIAYTCLLIGSKGNCVTRYVVLQFLRLKICILRCWQVFHVSFPPYNKSYLSFSAFRRSYMLSRMFCLALGYLCTYTHALQWEMKYWKSDKYPTVQSQPSSSVQMITSPSCASSVSSLCFTKWHSVKLNPRWCSVITTEEI